MSEGALSRILHGGERLRLAGHPLAGARRLAQGLAGVAFNYRGLRRRILRILAFHAMARVTPIVAVESGHLRFLVETADLGPGRVLFSRGSLEGEVLARALRAAGIPPRARSERFFVDIGANIGSASVLALGYHGFKGSVAVEPSAANAALLRANLAVNGLEDRCQVVVAAAGNTEDEIDLELSPDNFGDHRIRGPSGGAGEFREEHRTTERVPLRRVDAILESEAIPVDEVGLLWVDAQGSELQVLQGAGGLLRAAVPVVIEFWPYGLRRFRELEAFYELLESHFRSFVDLRRGLLQGEEELVREPIERLRALQPAAGVDDATDLLLLPTE